MLFHIGILVERFSASFLRPTECLKRLGEGWTVDTNSAFLPISLTQIIARTLDSI